MMLFNPHFETHCIVSVLRLWTRKALGSVLDTRQTSGCPFTTVAHAFMGMHP